MSRSCCAGRFSATTASHLLWSAIIQSRTGKHRRVFVMQPTEYRFGMDSRGICAKGGRSPSARVAEGAYVNTTLTTLWISLVLLCSQALHASPIGGAGIEKLHISTLVEWNVSGGALAMPALIGFVPDLKIELVAPRSVIARRSRTIRASDNISRPGVRVHNSQPAEFTTISRKRADISPAKPDRSIGFQTEKLLSLL